MALSSVFRISIRLLGIPSLPPVCQYLPLSTAGESTSSCSGWRSGSALEIEVKGNIASQVGVDVGYETLSSTPGPALFHRMLSSGYHAYYWATCSSLFC